MSLIRISKPAKGWHKRPIRDYCLKIFEQYKGLDIDLFTGLIKSFAGYDENKCGGLEESVEGDKGVSGFAKRLITGLAAEHYFESVRSDLLEFRGFNLENTTRLGCGYDFRLHAPDNDKFLAVEVKGLRGLTGGLSLTPREHEAAASLRDRFHLFVVKNFQKSPFHEVFPDPLFSKLEFKKSERIIVQVSWLASV